MIVFLFVSVYGVNCTVNYCSVKLHGKLMKSCLKTRTHTVKQGETIQYTLFVYILPIFLCGYTITTICVFTEYTHGVVIV